MVIFLIEKNDDEDQYKGYCQIGCYDFFSNGFIIGWVCYCMFGDYCYVYIK